MDHETVLKNTLVEILNTLIFKEKAEAQFLIEKSLEKIDALGFDLSDPDIFNTIVVYPIDNGVREMAEKCHKPLKKPIKGDNRSNFIYQHYNFLNSHIEALCMKREGGACSADKANSIIRMYLNYTLTGEFPECNPTGEKHSLPHFGTYHEWMDFCIGLYYLYYGYPEIYFKSYEILKKAKICKYPHTLNTWYLQLKDGKKLAFKQTWDNNDQNPLEGDKYLDKGNYFLVGSLFFNVLKGKKIWLRYLTEKKYKLAAGNFFYEVPKEDIVKIYKTSKNIMI